jgi:uncharacterized membrane protein
VRTVLLPRVALLVALAANSYTDPDTPGYPADREHHQGESFISNNLRLVSAEALWLIVHVLSTGTIRTLVTYRAAAAANFTKDRSPQRAAAAAA